LVAAMIAREVRAPAVRLADREVGRLARFLLALDPRQRGTNQRPVHRAVFDDSGRLLGIVARVLFRVLNGFDVLDSL
jgi:hypothetical protein